MRRRTRLAAGAPLTLGPCTAPAGTWWQELDPNGPADFQLYPWPKDSGYGNCVAASNFTDANGTRLVMGKCDQYDTSTLWNFG